LRGEWRGGCVLLLRGWQSPLRGLEGFPPMVTILPPPAVEHFLQDDSSALKGSLNDWRSNHEVLRLCARKGGINANQKQAASFERGCGPGFLNGRLSFFILLAN
jgi:hypothetical protein